MEKKLSKKIGWIGLGAMGTPMSMNLINEGIDLQVYNRTRSKENELKDAGADSASSPLELTDKNEIIFLMVSNDEAVKEIMTGEKGILASGSSGNLVINMSTVSPGLSRNMAGLCAEKEHRYLDAPVSGSVKQAKEATLLILCGGEKEALEEGKPYLDILGQEVFHMGKTGSGNAAKLAVNLYLGITTQALSEVVLFARKMGISAEEILRIINAGGLGSPYSKMKSDLIIADDYPPAFALKLMAKDLQLAVDNNLDSPMGSEAYNVFTEAAKTDLAEKDLMAVIKYLERIY